MTPAHVEAALPVATPGVSTPSLAATALPVSTPNIGLPTAPPATALPLATPSLPVSLGTPVPTPTTPTPTGGTPTPTGTPELPTPPVPPRGGGSAGGGGGTGGVGGTVGLGTVSATSPVSGTLASAGGGATGTLAGATSFTPASAHSGRPLDPAPATTPEQLTLSLQHQQLNPGSVDPFTVTVTYDGQPLAGASVVMSLLSAPGTDASVQPVSGVTNSSGTFSGALQLSRQTGDHLLLASSALASDEANVLGTTAQNGLGNFIGNLPFSLARNIFGNPLIVGLIGATFLLIIAGVIASVERWRVALWSVTLGRFIPTRRHARAR